MILSDKATAHRLRMWNLRAAAAVAEPMDAVCSG